MSDDTERARVCDNCQDDLDGAYEGPVGLLVCAHCHAEQCGGCGEYVEGGGAKCDNPVCVREWAMPEHDDAA